MNISNVGGAGPVGGASGPSHLRDELGSLHHLLTDSYYFIHSPGFTFNPQQLNAGGGEIERTLQNAVNTLLPSSPELGLFNNLINYINAARCGFHSKGFSNSGLIPLILATDVQDYLDGTKPIRATIPYPNLNPKGPPILNEFYGYPGELFLTSLQLVSQYPKEALKNLEMLEVRAFCKRCQTQFDKVIFIGIPGITRLFNELQGSPINPTKQFYDDLKKYIFDKEKE